MVGDLTRSRTAGATQTEERPPLTLVRAAAVAAPAAPELDVLFLVGHASEREAGGTGVLTWATGGVSHEGGPVASSRLDWTCDPRRVSTRRRGPSSIDARLSLTTVFLWLAQVLMHLALFLVFCAMAQKRGGWGSVVVGPIPRWWWGRGGLSGRRRTGRDCGIGIL